MMRSVRVTIPPLDVASHGRAIRSADALVQDNRQSEADQTERSQHGSRPLVGRSALCVPNRHSILGHDPAGCKRKTAGKAGIGPIVPAYSRPRRNVHLDRCTVVQVYSREAPWNPKSAGIAQWVGTTGHEFLIFHTKFGQWVVLLAQDGKIPVSRVVSHKI